MGESSCLLEAGVGASRNSEGEKKQINASFLWPILKVYPFNRRF